MSDRVILRTPPPRKPRLSLLADCYVEQGDKSDWDRLHELHYKAENMAYGPRFFRCVLAGELIGVGVLTYPKMVLRDRGRVFPHMKPGAGDTRLINQGRAKRLNKNYAVLSRLVLDTMYRGAGIAYRMQNLMMRQSEREIVEFQSSMSKFNPFAAKAGVRMVPPLPNPRYDIGVAWFRRWFEANPSDVVGVLEELASMPEAARLKCEREMRAFYYKHSPQEKTGSAAKHGTASVDERPIGVIVKQLQQLMFASPLYGIYENPDFGRVLPTRLPLLAFDAQPTDAPLTLSRAPT